MSRRRANGIQGPPSALTSFLREHGIRPPALNMYSRRVQPQAETPAEENNAEEGAAASEETPEAGPSNPESSPRRRGQRVSKRKRDDEDVNSDDLDEDSDADNDKPAVTTSVAASPSKAKPKTKKEIAAEAKAKAAAKKKAKKDGTYKSDDDEDDEGFSAPSKGNTGPRPPLGSLIKCASCDKRFPVTKYTQPASPPPGFLCHTCTKAGGIDPFKRQPAARKRKPEEKRKIINFEEKDRIPSLAQICISVITKHIDDVEALGNLGASNLNEICKILSRNRSLTPGNALLFYDSDSTNLTLYDCTYLDHKALSTLAALNPSLRSIRLDFCGRMNDEVLSLWSKHLPKLASIDLLGPFNVRNDAWALFLKNLEQPLEKFAITQSPRFDHRCLELLLTRCSTTLKTLRLQEVAKLDDGFIRTIGKFEGLVSLNISRPAKSLSDQALIDLLQVDDGLFGGRLTHLDISGHEDLTDKVFLRGIAPFCGRLTTLIAADLPLLTDAGIATFFGAKIDREDLEEPEASDDATADGENREDDPDEVMGDGEEPEVVLAAVIDEGPLPPSILPRLAHIDLSRSPQLGTLALGALLSHCGGPSDEDSVDQASQLCVLNINQWKNTSNENLLLLGPSLPHLRKIDVGWCRQVDNFVIKDLLDGCPRLKEILVAGCNLITSDCPRKRGVMIRGIEPGA